MKNELKPFYRNIKNLIDVKQALKISDSEWDSINNISITEAKYSALVALIRKALHIGIDTSLWNGCYYFPYFYMGKSENMKGCTSYNCENIIVKEPDPTGETHLSVCGGAFPGSYEGLASFDGIILAGGARADVGAVGCVSKEIAIHFGKYFGFFILKSWYGDKINLD